MTTIVKISRDIRHHEDVLRIERIEPESDSCTSFVLHIHESVEIELFGKNVSQLTEKAKSKRVRDVHKMPNCIDVLRGECPSCNGLVVTDTYVDITRFCRWCGQRLDWNGEVNEEN